jgi:streptomycin 6-kinase
LGLVDLAASLAAERAESGEPVVLGNRDYHLGNVLAARREPWLMIDPKPVAGERAFDTGHFLLDLVPDGSDARTVGALVDRVAGELDLDPSVVRAWAVIRCVDNALWRRRVGEDGESDAGLAAVLAN